MGSSAAGSSSRPASSSAAGASSAVVTSSSSSAGGACGVITTFAQGLGPTTRIHVQAGATAAGANGSEANPFPTISAAAAVATPGTAITIHAGTYAGGTFLTGLTGTAQAPIWLGGAPGESRPVLEGGGEGLHLVRAVYVVIHDLEIRNSTANGINADDAADYANTLASHHVVFERLNIHDIGSGGNQDCLKLSGLNNLWVVNNTFTACSAGGSAIDHVGCHNGVVAGNTFTNVGNAVQAKGGSTDILIRANVVNTTSSRAFNLGGSTGFEFFRPPLSTTTANAEAQRIHADANIILNAAEAIAFPGCVDCRVANNTIIFPTTRVFRILQETVSDATYTFTASSSGLVANNIILFNVAQVTNAGRALNVGGNTNAASYTFANNLWYAADNPATVFNLAEVTEMNRVTGQNPNLTNAATGDAHIPTNSPAVGVGRVVAGVDGDHGGRCWLNPPSIGAFEGG